MARGLVITCEHASRHVPREYMQLFASSAGRRALHSHRGFDPGALAIARQLATLSARPLYATRVSRLLIEPNRSIGHPRVWSEFTRRLSDSEKSGLLERFYAPHHELVEEAARAEMTRSGLVLHIAIHSFTPTLDGEIRRADIGLLYDPARTRERALAKQWQKLLSERLPELRVRRNYPYRGASDGLTTSLRKRLGNRYLGFEVEINQALIAQATPLRKTLARALSATLASLR